MSCPAGPPPFRADQVGSLLRPEKLRAARERFIGPQERIGADHIWGNA
jgi:methionine synthase II (cobalamin-independent)